MAEAILRAYAVLRTGMLAIASDLQIFTGDAFTGLDSIESKQHQGAASEPDADGSAARASVLKKGHGMGGN